MGSVKKKNFKYQILSNVKRIELNYSTDKLNINKLKVRSVWIHDRRNSRLVEFITTEVKCLLNGASVDLVCSTITTTHAVCSDEVYRTFGPSVCLSV